MSATIQTIIEESFIKNKDKIAIEHGGENLSYSKLNETSKQISLQMLNSGITENSFIGILSCNRVLTIASIISVLQIRGIFVFLDLDLPPKRLKKMMNTVNFDGILFDPEIKDDLITELVNKKCIKVPLSIHNKDIEASHESLRNNIRTYNREDKIYVYYTSGTKGEPKAIVGKNKSLEHFIQWEIETFGITCNFNFSQFTYPGFDAFLRDIFVPLCSGGKICIPQTSNLEFNISSEIKTWIDKRQINLIHTVPAYFKIIQHNIDENNFKGLKYILLSGEKIQHGELTNWYNLINERVKLINLYGATETTMIKTYYQICKNDVSRSNIPVGKAIKGARIVILDKYLKPCTIGSFGDIYIRTPYHTYGYLNDDKLSKEVFIPNPVTKDPNDLFYKTGDWGRILQDGNLELSGRKDNMVKIRGNRVELGEIENIVYASDSVLSAAVIAKRSNNEIQIYAYYVPKNNFTVQELKDHMLDYLPAYMIPAFFIELDELPLLLNGKIDYNRLPDPLKSEKKGMPVELSDKGRKIIDLWCKALKLEQYNFELSDNFFNLGGNSLKVITFLSMIEEEFNCKISFPDFYRNPTLSECLKRIDETVYQKAIVPQSIEKREYYSLSSAQKRIYILQLLTPDSLAYNMPRALMFNEDVDVEIITDIFKKLIKQHEAFRTAFYIANSITVQRIFDTVDFDIEFSYCKEENIEQHLKDFLKPFDLSRAPLLRVNLTTISKKKHLLLFDMHHIIGDAVSLNILINDFFKLYNGGELEPINVQYKDFAVYLNNCLTKNTNSGPKQFWYNQFKSEIPQLNLPTDFKRSAIRSFEGDKVRFEINKQDTGFLHQLAKDNTCTVFMILLGVYSVLLNKLSNQNEFVIGVPVNGRKNQNQSSVIGIYINMLPFKIKIDDQLSFSEYVDIVRKYALTAYENQEYQFDELVEELSLKRDTSRNPIFEVVLSYLSAKDTHVEFNDSKVRPYSLENPTTKFDLILHTVETTEKLVCIFEYSSKIFTRSTIELYRDYFLRIINELKKGTSGTIADINLISESHFNKILYAFNDTKSDYADHKCIHQLFESQVHKSPDSIAVEDGDIFLSYKFLNKQADNVRTALSNSNVVKGDFVGIIQKRRHYLISSLLGILNAGAGYVPFDPNLPAKRIKKILNSLQLKCIITDNMVINDIFKEFDNDFPIDHIISIGEEVGSKLKESNISQKCNICQIESVQVKKSGIKNRSSLDFAYVIYTSGSTGEPKGVLVRHRPVVNVIEWINKTMKMTNKDKILLVASVCFDLSVYDIFGILAAGGTLSISREDEIKDPQKLISHFYKSCITVWDSAPAALQQLIPFLKTTENKINSNGLRLAMLSGDWIPVMLPLQLKETFTNVQVVSLGGATEATIWSNYYFINDVSSNWKSIPYGKPIQNSGYYILDDRLNTKPTGVAGDLYIGGECLASGYINDPELTASKFIENPFVKDDIIYKTGDVARLMVNENIEFLGRKDFQVKIRGYRIEVGEIESKIRKINGILDVVLTIKENDYNDRDIYAYIVSEFDHKVAEIKKELAKELPDYMVPRVIIQIDKLPLTPNGKLDKEALPSHVFSKDDSTSLPQDSIEHKLCEIVGGLTKINAKMISLDFDFFEIGGNSLLATLLIARINKEFNLEMPLLQIFKAPVISDIASYIRVNRDSKKYKSLKKAEKKEYYNLTPHQKRIFNLYLLNRHSNNYNILSVYEIQGEIDPLKLESAINTLIQRHDSFRTTFFIHNNGPGQVVTQTSTFKLRVYKENCEKNINSIIRKYSGYFEMENENLFRIGLIQKDTNSFIFIIAMHHIITDGVSMNIFMKELISLYCNDEVKDVHFQYIDYSDWHNAKVTQEVLQAQKKFWINEFSNSIPVLDLPSDYGRKELESAKGDIHLFKFKHEYKELKKIASNTNTTLFMVVIALYYVLLNKLGGQSDIVVGVPTSGRNKTEIQDVIGMFVNTLAVRINSDMDKTFIEFLMDIKPKIISIFDNQDYQFDDLVKDLSINRKINRNPLFDVALVYDTIGFSETGIKDLVIKPYKFQEYVSKFDITLFAYEKSDEELHFKVEYKTAMFKRETIERYFDYFQEITEGVIKKPNTLLRNLHLKLNSIDSRTEVPSVEFEL